MDYSLYRAEDFASDESFINYYLKQNDEDESFWANWISTHPEKLDEVLAAERLLSLLTITISDEEYEYELTRFRLAIEQDDAIQVNKPGKRWLFVWSGIAASLIICFTAVVWWQQNHSDARVKMLTEYTRPGQQKALQLQDGTKIILNGASTLEYPERFSGRTREVRLNGEAYFEVAKDKSHPFTVHTGRLNTTVLGTKFNINNQDANNIKVSLLEGRVKVTGNGIKGTLLLLPGGQAKLSGGHLMMNGFDQEEVIAWKNYGLKLDGASFEELSAKMYKTFGIRLLNHSSKRQWAYTGTFAHTDYLSIVRTITYANHLHYQVKRDTVIIK